MSLDFLYAPVEHLDRLLAVCTRGFAWILTRPRIERVTNRVLVPAVALFGIGFGAVYAVM